jgi:YNFM family putative membrane transporter
MGFAAGSADYRRANLAMFIAGFACFAMLYAPQPLLPLLAEVFTVSPATASLAVSAGTLTLALMLIPASVLADRIGRRPLMQISLAASALFALLAAFAQDFTQLLVLRGLLGAALAGVPAAALAYLGEEIAPAAQGRAIGLYIGGNALGGMSGRYLAALFTDWFEWRVALGTLGALGVLAAIVFWRSLPAAQNFQVRHTRFAALHRDIAALFADPGLPRLFLVAFLLMGALVGLYNFLGFRLIAPPYELSPAAIGAVFLLYALGSLASALAGRVADRVGRRNVLWVMVAIAGAGVLASLAAPLPFLIAGVAVFTFGYFGAHAAASGWVGRRAGERRALASALYLGGYYLGGSVIGFLAGFAWIAAGWPGVVGLLSACVGGALWLALQLRTVPAAR